ncbi:MAG TPA: carbamoyltransferase HypF, partial [Actinoplanes sp.]|nr:carbamoyltransferase HypF [Actinoplanes sp.]
MVTAPAATGERITVTGTVQGVGFRPFVWRTATSLGLTGTVRNRAGIVEIEAYGPPAALADLVVRLRREAPGPASVRDITVAAVHTPPQSDGFEILQSSESGAGEDRLFPPDLATCDACVAEMFDPADRRFGYPFINCTDCGPRASIVDRLPYDRPNTTMRDFPMCADCRREYTDPGDRRFHAEPIACPVCGPQLRWQAGDERAARADALAAAVAMLRAGGIVAVKGIGGYHLACDATDPDAVLRLRRRKHRWAKPFAVMAADLTAARGFAEVDEAEARLLTSTARPIVLLEKAAAPLAPRVAAEVCGDPDHGVGVFLAYTGLHHLLLAELARPLVLTSGNRTDEPIAVDDAEALDRLAGIADGFLLHDRRIRARFEDSVALSGAAGPVLLRRGRGFAPAPLDLPVPAPEPILAVGAQLKHTFTIAQSRSAHVGGHNGDLEDAAAMDAYRRDLTHLQELLAVNPTWVAHDLHPGYLSTRQAVAEFPAHRRLPVQHHHAHIAACMAEHGLRGPVVGIAMDGLGFGDDDTLWGGEVLIADLIGYRRVARFGRAPLPGGAAAVREPWRMALGYLFGAEADPADEPEPALSGAAEQYLSRFDPAALRVLRRQIERGVNAPQASSAGRLFDAASALLGICDTAHYEGQAAIAL